jgi:L-serine/L-threonine ammonia-lyase
MLHITTPTIKYNGPTTQKVWLKLENLQPSASFKLRGIGHLCQRLLQRKDQRILCSSGGNAGLAAAYCARELGLPCTVVVPITTTQHAIQSLKSLGAAVVQFGNNWGEAHAHLLSMTAPDDILVHPFDHPIIWEGHSTIIDELDIQPEFIVCSVGGGGLLNGIVQGVQKRAWQSKIVAVETIGADSLHQSILSNSRITLPAITSIATSLGATQISQQTFAHATSPDTPIISLTVTDSEAIQACKSFLDTHRMLVEPACGASLAMLHPDKISFFPAESTILVIVCGGGTMTVERLLSIN